MAVNGEDVDDQPVTDTTIKNLSMEDFDWRFLERDLNMNEAVLQSIGVDHTSHQEKKYQTLLAWKRAKGSPTIGDLIAALTKHKRLDLIEVLRGKEPRKDGQHPVKEVTSSKPREAKVSSKASQKATEDERYSRRIIVFAILGIVVAILAIYIWNPSEKTPVEQDSVGTEGKQPSIRPKARVKGRHNMVLADTSPSDIILHRDFKQVIGKLHRGKQRHTFQYHKKPNEVITAVLVEDQWDDDTGGTPKRIDGGPGENRVEVEITSQFGRGFHFIFIVYGKRE